MSEPFTVSRAEMDDAGALASRLEAAMPDADGAMRAYVAARLQAAARDETVTGCTVAPVPVHPQSRSATPDPRWHVTPTRG